MLARHSLYPGINSKRFQAVENQDQSLQRILSQNKAAGPPHHSLCNRSTARIVPCRVPGTAGLAALHAPVFRENVPSYRPVSRGGIRLQAFTCKVGSNRVQFLNMSLLLAHTAYLPPYQY